MDKWRQAAPGVAPSGAEATLAAAVQQLTAARKQHAACGPGHPAAGAPAAAAVADDAAAPAVDRDLPPDGVSGYLMNLLNEACGPLDGFMGESLTHARTALAETLRDAAGCWARGFVRRT